MGLTRAELRGRITSLYHLLMTLCLMQTKMLLAAFAARARGTWHGQLGVHQDSQMLFCQDAFQEVGCTVLFLLRGKTSHFPLFNFMRLVLALQPAKVPLNGRTPIWSISHSSQETYYSAQKRGEVF